MGLEDRIIYSKEQMAAALENTLDHLKAFRYDGQYRLLLGDAFVDKLSAWEDDIRQRKDDPFTLVVVGDFKRGKSTFINALLGEEVVTTDVTTETVTLNRISYGPHSSEAVLPGGRRIRLADEELRREELEKVIAQAGVPVEKLELKRPIELLKSVTIIDTPGTGDSMQDFSQMVKESLLQADAVVYIYNVKYPLSQTEQLFLKSAVLPQRYTTLFLVGNYADTMENEENYERIRAMLAERTGGLLPNAELLTISALDELCRQMGEERPCETLAPVLESQFAQLRSLLNTLVEEKRDTVVLDRMQRLTAAMIADLETELDAVEAGLRMDSAAAGAALEKLKTEKQGRAEKQATMMADLDSLLVVMKNEANRWMGEFLGRIEAESKTLDNQSTDTLLKYYEFYCVDLLQEAVNTCVEHHQEQLYDRLDEVSAGISAGLVDSISQRKPASFRMSLDNRIWTKGDTVGLTVSLVSGTGLLAGAASLVADGISGLMREKEKQQQPTNIISQIAGKLTGLSLSVSETVEAIYTELGQNARKLVEEYYAEQMAEAERLINQSAKVAMKKTEEKEQLQAVVDRARKLLREVGDVLGE